MFKKILSLMAAVVLVAACETGPNDGAMSGTEGTGNVQTGNSQTPGSAADFSVNVGDRIFFGYDRSDLSAEARGTLDKQAEWLKKYPRKSVTVEGHADERGTREYNLALGERRASAVKNYLAAAGVGKGVVHVISYGKERPAVLGGNEAAWAQNRRGVTVVGE
jgi:peptidoglycan-associated lipoprotein